MKQRIHGLAFEVRIDFRVRKDTAPLKHRITDFSAGGISTLPCPQGHGPIEASLENITVSPATHFRVRKDTAPLKPRVPSQAFPGVADFRVRKDTAPLKLHFIPQAPPPDLTSVSARTRPH